MFAFEMSFDMHLVVQMQRRWVYIVTVWLVWLSQRMACTDHMHAVVGVTDCVDGVSRSGAV